MKEIRLSDGSRSQVDDEDFDKLNAYKWHLSPKGYAQTNAGVGGGNRKSFLLHQLILDYKGPDHVDRNKLNNQKHNLRPATNAQNQYNRELRKDNTSGYKGVRYIERLGKYIAVISVNKKKKHLGCFDTAAMAYEAYKKEARILHGEFACL